MRLTLKKQLADTRSKVSQRADQVKGMADDSYGKLRTKEDQGDRILLAMARRINEPIDLPKTDSEYDASAFQKDLKSQLDELQKGPQDVSEFDKMLAGLGPVLVGLAAGGNAGMNALGMGNAELDRARKLIADDRKTKIESVGKQIEGTGKLLAAEAEMNKAKMSQAKEVEEIKRNRMNDFRSEHKDMTQVQKDFFTNVLSKDENFQKFLMTGDEKQALEAIKNARAQMKETNSIAKDGVKEFVGTQQKALDATADLKKAKISASGKRDDWIKFAEDVDPNRSRTGNFGKVQSTINAADRVDAIFKQFPDYNIPKSQTHELATAVAALIGGGNPQSQKQIDDIVPNSVNKTTEGIAAWLSNDPRGLNQQKFMRLMHETALREREVAEGQKREIINSRVPKWNQLYMENPAKYRAILQGQNIKPEEVDEKGMLKPRAVKASDDGASNANPRPHPQDETALQWAKDHPSDPRSAKILKANGL
jgi:hypothetical protein